MKSRNHLCTANRGYVVVHVRRRKLTSLELALCTASVSCNKFGGRLGQTRCQATRVSRRILN